MTEIVNKGHPNVKYNYTAKKDLNYPTLTHFFPGQTRKLLILRLKLAFFPFED